jgi:hypothetical protein
MNFTGFDQFCRKYKNAPFRDAAKKALLLYSIDYKQVNHQNVYNWYEIVNYA